MSNTETTEREETVFEIAARLPHPDLTVPFPEGSYFLIRDRKTGLYYDRDKGFSALVQGEASVVGTHRAAMIVANMPDGSVEVVPVSGRPMLS